MMRFFSRESDDHSIHLLNATQFLGALNDNYFKLLIVYTLIAVWGEQEASSILALAGGIFVIPFLLFSSAAGVLADRISKRAILVSMKLAETVVMMLGTIAIWMRSGVACYTLLFLMASQSAIFGPSKYGIIPELVEPKRVTKANGLLTSFTYLAIIFGTFLASFISDITNKNFIYASLAAVVFAIIGLGTSLGITKVQPKRTKKRINPFFIYEIYQSLKISYTKTNLLTAIFGSAFFLFIGGFTQLNIIPFAIQSLGLSDIGGGYLFLATAVGIAFGAVFAGKLSRGKAELGLPCIAGFFLAILFLLLSLFSHSLPLVIIILILLGVFGGILLIPFDSFIQLESPEHQRGRIIAAANFLSFCGVLLAAIVLYVISEEFGFSAASGFIIMGVTTLIFTIFISGRLSDLFLPFVVNKFLLRYYALQVRSPTPTSNSILIMQKSPWRDVLMLFSFIPNLRIIVFAKFMRKFPWFNGLFNNIIRISPPSSLEDSLQKAFEKAKICQEKEGFVCLFLNKKYDQAMIRNAYKRVFGTLHSQVYFVHVKHDTIQKVFFSTSFRQKQISITFTKNP